MGVQMKHVTMSNVLIILNGKSILNNQMASKQIEMGLGACDVRCIRLHYVPGKHLTKG